MGDARPPELVTWIHSLTSGSNVGGIVSPNASSVFTLTRVGAFEDLVDIRREAMRDGGLTWPVTHELAFDDPVANPIDTGEVVLVESLSRQAE